MSNLVEARFNFVAGGTIGEEGVFKALIGNPDVEVERIVLPGYGLRMQLLEDIRQKDVRDDLYQGWNVKRGIPFLYATTLWEEAGEETQVSLARLNSNQLDLAMGRFGEWNYHPQGWFGFRLISIDGADYITETLLKEDKLHPMPERYQEDPAYKRFVKVMEEEIKKATFLPSK